MHSDSKHLQFYSLDVPQLLLRYLEDYEWNSILDVGCGDGAFLNALRRRGFLKNKSIYATDISKDKIDMFKKLDTRFNAFVGNAENLVTIQDNAIDFVISSQVIEHIENDGKFIRGIQRVLKHNGICYLSTVFKKKYGWYFYRNDERWVLDPTHIREYEHNDQLLEIINNCGLETIESNKSVIKYPFIELLLRKTLPDRHIFNFQLFNWLRFMKLPIIGYYCWEIIFRK